MSAHGGIALSLVLLATLSGCTQTARSSTAYIDINGVRTYYEKYGSGPPVVLLHGAAMVAEAWKPQIDALAPHFTVYVPERRGVGRTADVDGDWTYDAMAADTATLMDRLGVRRAAIIGVSDGGIIGLILASTRSDLVDALIISGANRNVAGMGDDLLAAARLPSEELVTNAPPEVAPWLEIQRAVSPDHGAALPRSFAKLQRMWLDIDISIAQLQTIGARTLVMGGDHDMIPVAHTVEIWAAIPKAQLCIAPNAGHFWLEEKADLANRIILDFLLTDSAPHIASP